MRNPQVDRDGRLVHLLSIEGLSRAVLHRILDDAQAIADGSMASPTTADLPLRGKRVANLFFTADERAHTAFTGAAQSLGAETIDLEVVASGYSLMDAINEVVSMQPDIAVLRHAQSGASHLAARQLGARVHVLNAGDGCHAHPVQALRHMAAIRRYKHDFPSLTVAVVGAVLHSALARSCIHALTTLGAPEVRVIAPPTLMPPEQAQMGVHVWTNIERGLEGADVVILLPPPAAHVANARRLSTREIAHGYALTSARLALARPDALVLDDGKTALFASHSDTSFRHLGPDQLQFGCAMEAAVLRLLIGI